MVVGDDDLRLAEFAQHLGRHEFPLCVVGLGVIRQEDAEAVADRDAGCHDEKSARELLAAGTACRVDRLPGDQHGHDRGLAGACGELECEAVETGIGLLVGAFEVVEERPAALPELRRDFVQPDRGLGGFDLAEEGAEALELVMAPMLEEPGGLRRHLPLRGVGLAGAKPRPPRAGHRPGAGDRSGPRPRRVRPTRSSSACFAAPLRFFGAGMGVMNFAGRRVSEISCVGCPFSSSTQWRSGYS